MDSSWNIGMQGGFGSDTGVRAGGFFIGRRRWPAREKDLGHDVQPEQIKPAPPPDAQTPRKPERPPPEVSP